MEKGVVTSCHRNSNVPQGGRNPERQSPQHCFSIALFMPKGSTMLGHVHNAILCNGIEFNTSGQKKQKKNTHQTPRMTLKTFRQFWSNPTTWHYKRFCVSKTARQRKLCSQSNQLSRNVCLRAKLVASSASAFISLCSSRVVLQCVYLVLKYSAPLAERL